MASLSIRDVRKRFGMVTVLHGIDIEVADGEFLILVGPSGCGKSTLLSMIAGLDAISEGQIVIDGKVVNNLGPKDRDIAMVFQSYALYPSMTVRENIGFALEMRKAPKAEREAVVARVAKTLQIDSLLERRPAQLSGGQRQRVAMGRALARDPKVFLFDEPLSNLDAKLRVEMRAEIKSLHQRLKSTVVYVTHDQVEAMTLGDRIAVMKDGRVQQLGTPEDIYERPENLYVAGFIGSPTMNFLPATLRNEGGTWVVDLVSDAGSTKLRLGASAAPGRPNALTAPGDTKWPLQGQGGSERSELGGHVIDATWDGREVIVGLRPEHWREAAPGEAGALPVTIDLIEPTGADTYGFANVNGKHVAMRLPPKRLRAAGETMQLVADGAGACLFDPASERRIAL